MKRVSPLLTACLCFFAFGCGDSSGGSGSGGAAGTLDGPDVMLTAATEAVYTVGALAGEDWETFGTVGPVSFDGAGNLHILDTQADRIVVVAPDGSFVRTVGKPGEGPGEFDSPRDLIVNRDGGYVVSGFSSIELFEPEGEYVRSIPQDPVKGFPMSVQGLSNGRLVTGSVMRIGMPGATDSGGDEADAGGRPIEVFPLDDGDPEVLYTAWELPAISDDDSDMSTQTSSTGTMMRMTMAPPRAFVPGLHFEVLSDGRLAVVDSIGYRVKLVGIDGAVVGTIERPIAPTPVTDAIRSAERERRRAEREGQESMVVGSGSRFTVNLTRGSLDDMTFADEIPVVDDMVVDWEDRIWVVRTGEDGQGEGPIDIVTPDGSYVGTLSADGLRTPAAFGPDGLMAYIELDEYEVQSVRVIRLVSLDR